MIMDRNIMIQDTIEYNRIVDGAGRRKVINLIFVLRHIACI